MRFERVVEREEAGEVRGICYKSCPDWFRLACAEDFYFPRISSPFFDSVTLSLVVIVNLGAIGERSYIG